MTNIFLKSLPTLTAEDVEVVGKDLGATLPQDILGVKKWQNLLKMKI